MTKVMVIRRRNYWTMALGHWASMDELGIFLCLEWKGVHGKVWMCLHGKICKLIPCYYRKTIQKILTNDTADTPYKILITMLISSHPKNRNPLPAKISQYQCFLKTQKSLPNTKRATPQIFQFNHPSWKPCQ